MVKPEKLIVFKCSLNFSRTVFCNCICKGYFLSFFATKSKILQHLQKAHCLVFQGMFCGVFQYLIPARLIKPQIKPAF